MQAKKLTFAEGWRWLFSGFSLYRRNPLMLALLLISYWLAMAVLNTLPLIGPVLATVAIPAFSVSLMNAIRRLDAGQLLTYDLLFSGFHKELKTLLLLGGLYLGTCVLALAATSVADGGMFFQTVLGSYKASKEDMISAEFLTATQIAMILMTPVVMAWWYSPLLVAWNAFPAGKSLFFSLIACLRNWRAFTAYSLCTVLFCVILPGMLLALFMIVMPDMPEGFGSGLYMVLMAFVIAPTAIASFYVSYREVFTESPLELSATATSEGRAETTDTPPSDPPQRPSSDA